MYGLARYSCVFNLARQLDDCVLDPRQVTAYSSLARQHAYCVLNPLQVTAYSEPRQAKRDCVLYPRQVLRSKPRQAERIRTSPGDHVLMTYWILRTEPSPGDSVFGLTAYSKPRQANVKLCHIVVSQPWLRKGTWCPERT